MYTKVVIMHFKITENNKKNNINFTAFNFRLIAKSYAQILIEYRHKYLDNYVDSRYEYPLMPEV